MDITTLAIPSNTPGGMNATVSDHFGKCDFYTLVEIENKTIRSIKITENPPHTEGGCMLSVQNLAAKGISGILVAGMGMHPLNGFQQAGINVFFAKNTLNVGQAVQAWIDNKLQKFSADDTCKGHH